MGTYLYIYTHYWDQIQKLTENPALKKKKKDQNDAGRCSALFCFVFCRTALHDSESWLNTTNALQYDYILYPKIYNLKINMFWSKSQLQSHNCWYWYCVVFTSRISNGHQDQFTLGDTHPLSHGLYQILCHSSRMGPHAQVGIHRDVHVAWYCKRGVFYVRQKNLTVITENILNYLNKRSSQRVVHEWCAKKKRKKDLN